MPFDLGRNVCIVGEYKDVFYIHSECECNSPDHGQHLWIELDNEDGAYVSCTISQDLFWFERNQYEVTWYKRVWFRLKKAVLYLITGHVRVSGEHLFTSEQHIRDYANAMLTAIDVLHEKRKQSKRLPPMQETTGK